MLAGVNGAGKSSILGAALREAGADYFNPDELARELVARGRTPAEANAEAWATGRTLLERAIDERLTFAFETTLGGKSITELLVRAARNEMRIRMIYVGLESAELHICRGRQRVAQGGHDIPGDRIRQRWTTSRRNLIRLLPVLTDLRLFDNSNEASPEAGHAPTPRLLLEIRDRQIVATPPLDQVPAWAKPVLMAAAKLKP